MIREKIIRKLLTSLFFCLICLVILSSCIKSSQVELTDTSPYSQVIGTKYRVIAPVEAYGIYEDLNNKVIAFIELIPGVGIEGPEVAFRKRVVKGQIITVLSAWQENTLLHSDVYYVITLQGADFPQDIQLRIELSRGNEGDGAELNPLIYERM